MALDPNYLQSLPQSLVDMYGLVEIDILTDMARRIETYDFFIPSAMHQNQKLQELGMVQEEIIERLAALTGRTQEEIVALLTEAGEVAIEDDVEYYKAAEVYEPKKVNTEALYAALNAGLLMTQQAFFNITGTTANTATKQFERALDRAWTQINTGGMDYKTAIRRAIEGLSDDGIGAVEYPSGRIDTLETAVRRAVVTGANQTAAKTQEVLADELESELVEVTAHGGARPEHAKWQGQVFSRNGRKTIDGVTYEDLRKATGYGKAGGLCGVNCRHNFHPYIPGTARTWDEKELEALKEKKVEYNGKKLTEYEASQVQRGMEKEIRKLKRKAAALEAAGLDASEVQRDLREGNKIYSDFTKQTGIRRQPDRLKVAKGTDITGPSGNRPQNSEIGIENAGKSDTMSLRGFNTTDDPMREVTGAGLKSHPKETGKMVKDLKDAGAEVEHRDGTMCYQPSLISGKPGRFVIDKEASYSAWMHEYTHFLDDKEDGYLGFRVFMDTEKCIQREAHAYDIEIELARKANRQDIVERLEKLKQEEIARYKTNGGGTV